MKVIIHKGEIEFLRPLVCQWIAESDTRFGINITPDAVLKDLQDLITDDGSSALLVLMDNEKPIGFMGVMKICTVGGVMASEKYWYVNPEYRHGQGLRLINKATELARKAGCSHLVLTASALANENYERICEVYERLKFKEFERSYIRKLE